MITCPYCSSVFHYDKSLGASDDIAALKKRANELDLLYRDALDLSEFRQTKLINALSRIKELEDALKEIVMLDANIVDCKCCGIAEKALDE